MVEREKVEVTWIDSHSRYGWETAEATARFIAERLDLTCTTVGYKFAEDEESLYVIFAQAADDLVNHLMVIPKVAIKKIRKLK